MCSCFSPGAAEVHTEAGKWFDDKEIYEWFTANLHRVREPSLRHYVRAKELKAAGMDWTEVLAAEDENPRARLAAEPLEERRLRQHSGASKSVRRARGRLPGQPSSTIAVSSQAGRRPVRNPPRDARMLLFD